MASSSSLSYSNRAAKHQHPVTKRFFETADAEKSNLIVSADLTTTAELLDCAYVLGPYIDVLKTHVDLLSDFEPKTVEGLKFFSKKHNFMIFEDQKFVDIGNTVQKQYHGGALRISEFADIVNVSILAAEDLPYSNERAFIILADMTSKGSLATGTYTEKSVEFARKHSDCVIGFVAMKSLADINASLPAIPNEDFIIFTTGINWSSSGDKLGQQYKTPAQAVQGDADFIISGRGIYAAVDRVETAKQHQKEGWDAYLDRL
ncbi:orotidine 5'-phosphate decarboxylase [Mytilinidion resinicola]|uniref:Orotidine 5'-phosphate decarboxylase n=1 Tax=Mytilinidion resinicola TaxID=574789 RepID=A0A6A6YGI1_9PEZI|nr:orotidine 5'-phosphate decarboxylase [Mytilinidion resinicola]KAF2807007.1 orotidine 5'-phosphate decarboxylase [Mytilinidion resinicola]